jgi:hypothetical protein
MWGALSDERTGVSFTIAAGPRQRSYSRDRVPWDSIPYFTVSDLDFPLVASYDSQGYDGGIRPRLHKGFKRFLQLFSSYSFRAIPTENTVS